MLRFVPVLLCALVVAAPAGAGNIGVGFAVKAGSLGAAAPAEALGGTIQVPVTVVDARGNGAGWTLRLSGGATVTRVSARCGASSTCTLPTLSLAGGSTLTASRGTGMGAMTLVVTLSGGHGPLGVTVR